MRSRLRRCRRLSGHPLSSSLSRSSCTESSSTATKASAGTLRSSRRSWRCMLHPNMLLTNNKGFDLQDHPVEYKA